MDEHETTGTDAPDSTREQRPASENPTTEKLGDLDLSDEAVLAGCVEAILLTTDKAMGAQAIAQALSLDGAAGPKARIDAAVESLNAVYEETGRAFRIRAIAGGYRVMTEPDFAPALLAMHGARQQSKLSKPALETLAIVAYRQPVTRAQIESIRGVSCGEVVKTLLERRLLDIVGRAEELGRPMLYGTSKHFLEVFGLASVKDLPAVGDVPVMPTRDIAPPEEPTGDSDDQGMSEESATTDETPEGAEASLAAQGTTDTP